jgi:hypothetical protein
MPDPTPAELATILRIERDADANYDGLGVVQISSERASTIADALDRLATLEASLSDEWGTQRDSTTPATSREQAERTIARQRTRPPGYRITNQALVRRRVTPWEVIPDGK